MSLEFGARSIEPGARRRGPGVSNLGGLKLAHLHNHRHFEEGAIKRLVVLKRYSD